MYGDISAQSLRKPFEIKDPSDAMVASLLDSNEIRKTGDPLYQGLRALKPELTLPQQASVEALFEIAKLSVGSANMYAYWNLARNDPEHFREVTLSWHCTVYFSLLPEFLDENLSFEKSLRFNLNHICEHTIPVLETYQSAINDYLNYLSKTNFPSLPREIKMDTLNELNRKLMALLKEIYSLRKDCPVNTNLFKCLDDFYFDLRSDGEVFYIPELVTQHISKTVNHEFALQPIKLAEN